MGNVWLLCSWNRLTQSAGDASRKIRRDFNWLDFSFPEAYFQQKVEIRLVSILINISSRSISIPGFLLLTYVVVSLRKKKFEKIYGTKPWTCCDGSFIDQIVYSLLNRKLKYIMSIYFGVLRKSVCMSRWNIYLDLLPPTGSTGFYPPHPTLSGSSNFSFPWHFFL